MRFTKNHIAVDGDTLGPSDLLRRSLGGETVTWLDPIGTRVEAGKPFGRIEGENTACHLYAPFTLTITGHDRDRISVKIEGPAREVFLEEHEYRAYFEKFSR